MQIAGLTRVMSSPESGGGPMALFVLLPATTRTGIVASDFGFFPFDGLDYCVITTNPRRLTRRLVRTEGAIRRCVALAAGEAREWLGSLRRVIEKH
jgi:hypothetical protein